MEAVKKFIEFVLGELCEKKDEIMVRLEETDRGAIFFASVAESDMGQLIGRKGQTVSALRTLVQSMGIRDEKRYYFRAVEPEDNHAPSAQSNVTAEEAMTDDEGNGAEVPAV